MHNNTLRRVSTHASTTTTSSRITPSIHTRRSTDSRILEQVLQDGDEIGPGRFLLDQPISVVHARSELVPNLRVLRKLATGSYAVVYLVQEIIPPTTASNFLNLSENEDSPPLTPAAAAAPAQGRLFALKCLEKHAQDQDAQLLEATIHQSLPVHQNIVTLWSTLETESYLLLVLDYVPGEDLFYFLEQFRDYDESHLDRDPSSPTSSAPTSTAGLAWLEPSQLLSYHRLRLVASMFAQMCEAVAHCHRHGVFHRDIKPENFMVTDTRIQDPVTGEYKRSVTVKLTDFGLATRDPESGDMDCGSAPYMSFECRNFITPMYATAPADVWSLGIVLLNMLYHANPWMSSAFGACQSFDSFLREPIRFFMERFPGMTPAVAEFFARRVFCLLEVPPTMDNTGNTSPLSPHYANNVGRRITAEEFGFWARDLQLHLGPSARRTPALAFQQTPSPIPSSSTPNSRPRSPGETSLTNTTRLMAPSVSQPGTRTPSPAVHTRPPVPVHPATINNGTNGTDVTPYQSDSEEEDVGRSRTTSSKRRKRAPRGNKAQTTPTTPATGTATTAPPAQPLSMAAEYAAIIRATSTTNDDRLRELATKSEMVAREASKLTKTPPSTTAPLQTTTPSVPIINPPTVTTARSTPELRTKRSTKWTDIFRRDSGSDQEVPTLAQVAQMDADRESLSSPIQVLPPVTLPSSASVGNLATKQTGTARNVSDLLRSLDSTAPAANPASTVRSGDVLDDGMSWSGNSNGRTSSFSSRGRRKDRRAGGDRESQRAPSPGSIFSVSTTSTANSTSNRNRGQSAPNHDRRQRSKSPTQAALEHFNMLMPTSGDSAPPAVSPSGHPQRLVYVPESPPPPVPIVPEQHRGFVPVPTQVQQQQQVEVSPAAGQSNRRSYAPSIASVSTTTTSSSVFTAFSGKNSRSGRYSSNASVRSVSTAATSISSSSTNWRNEANPPLPSNIKPMKGIPKELDQLPQLPRHMQPRPKDNSRNRRRPPSAPNSPTPGSSFGLDTISEKPKKSAMKQPKVPVPPLPSSYHEEPMNPNLQRLNDAIRGSEFGGPDPSIKSFGRGGPGLQIDPEIANAASGYPTGANVALPPQPQNVENAPGRPAKTPTRSRLWSWRR